MADPREGIAPDGTIRTGARRDRVPEAFEAVLADAVSSVTGGGASLYLYGSVANGTATAGASDVDLLSIDLPDAAALSRRLSTRYDGLCRAVEIGNASAADLGGESDSAYGNRVFLRHYCVHLAGPDPAATLPTYPADVRAARGFNGDLGLALDRWRGRIEAGEEAGPLGRRAARKALLGVAGLVSVQDGIWTTDRAGAARRWAQVRPDLAGDLARLLAWARGEAVATRRQLRADLAGDGVLAAVTAQFAEVIGLWSDPMHGRGGDGLPG